MTLMRLVAFSHKEFFILLLAVFALLHGCGTMQSEILRDNVSELGSYEYNLDLVPSMDGENEKLTLYLDNPLERTGERNCFVQSSTATEVCSLRVQGWGFWGQKVLLLLDTPFSGATQRLEGHISDNQVAGDIIFSHWGDNKIGVFRLYESTP